MGTAILKALYLCLLSFDTVKYFSFEIKYQYSHLTYLLLILLKFGQHSIFRISQTTKICIKPFFDQIKISTGLQTICYDRFLNCLAYVIRKKSGNLIQIDHRYQDDNYPTSREIKTDLRRNVIVTFVKKYQTRHGLQQLKNAKDFFIYKLQNNNKFSQH